MQIDVSTAIAALVIILLVIALLVRLVLTAKAREPQVIRDTMLALNHELQRAVLAKVHAAEVAQGEADAAKKLLLDPTPTVAPAAPAAPAP